MTISWSMLRDARTAKGWTQKELADHLAVHPKTVVNWERDGNSVSSKAEYRVRRALGPYIDYALYLEGLGGGEPALPVETWLRYQAGYQEPQRPRPLESLVQEEVDLRAERAAEAARRLRLSDFATIDLLTEVQRRVRSDGSVRDVQEADNVPTLADDEHADEDWDVSEAPSKDQVALAAKKAPRRREH